MASFNVSPSQHSAPCLDGDGERPKALLIATILNRTRRSRPFDHADENSSYAHLTEICARCGIDLHLTHFDLLQGGEETFCWSWSDAGWKAQDTPLARFSLCYADLPLNFQQAVRFGHALGAHPITIINDLQLSDLLTDKLATYELFSEHVPLSLAAENTQAAACLRASELHPDLSIREVFLKPRFGERGRGIQRSELGRLDDHPAMGREDYIVQAFLETSSGIAELAVHGRHDLRLIVCNGDIQLAFLRLPKAGSYISNFACGGSELPLDVDRIPKRCREFAAQIDARLSQYGPRLYSLDLGFGRSGKIWIFELNTMPGLVWDQTRPETRPLHQRMHRLVAKWMRSALPVTVPDTAGGRDRWRRR